MYGNFDLYEFCAQLMPPLLRRPILLSFLKVLMQPLNVLYILFVRTADDAILRLSHKAYTINMERYLNEVLNTTGIYIRDYILEQTIYLAYSEEDKPADYMSLKNEGHSGLYVSDTDKLLGGFTVMIPAVVATTANLQTVRDYVDRYKFAGTRYNIKIY